jgi:hypothetical protein
MVGGRKQQQVLVMSSRASACWGPRFGKADSDARLEFPFLCLAGAF